MSDGICASVLAHSSLLVDISLSLSYVIKRKTSRIMLRIS